MKLDVRKVDDDLAIIIPRELATQLEWGPGDILEVERADGGIKAMRVETAHERAMKIARKGMEKYSSVFEKLAKS